MATDTQVEGRLARFEGAKERYIVELGQFKAEHYVLSQERVRLRIECIAPYY